MVRHYALYYGFHTFRNVLKTHLERGMWLCLYTNALHLTSPGISFREGQGVFHFKEGWSTLISVNQNALFINIYPQIIIKSSLTLFKVNLQKIVTKSKST